MKPGDIIFMVVVVAVAIVLAIVKAVKGKVPAWVGFLLMIAASLVAIVGGAATKDNKIIPLGVAGVIGAGLAWISGATSSGVAESDTLGGVASGIPLWAWLIDGALLVGAIVAIFLIP